MTNILKAELSQLTFPLFFDHTQFGFFYLGTNQIQQL